MEVNSETVKQTVNGIMVQRDCERAGLNKMKNEKWRINNYFKRKNYSLLIINYKFKRAVAFTLAEVLITLGVIGVVAAITMPILIQNYKKHNASVKLKSFYSIMSQAVMRSELDNGFCYNWRSDNNGDIRDQDGNYDYAAQADYTWNYWNKYLAPYMKYTKAEKGIYDEDNPDDYYETKVYLPNGMTFTLHNGGTIDMVVDINGSKGPNEQCKDIYGFGINTSLGTMMGNKHFGASYQYMDRNQIMSSTMYSMICGRLLEIDNFEFKDDYPFKL